ncbi:MAG: deoxynucleoside kinase [Bacteroidia bacterium]|nr:deoxynucleoside kinase [Bacteroidia bacterium]
MFETPYQFIAIEGNIGAGKSTLVNMLSDVLKAKKIMEEFEDNSFLPKFYENRSRYAFPLEMSFLAARFNQLKKQLVEDKLFGEPIISDYIFAKCLLFSQNTLDDDEYKLYRQMFEIINFQIPQPDLLVYLHAPIEKLQWNISNRGRVYEKKIEDNYLQSLQETYFKYMNSQTNTRVLVVNCAGLDFVNNTKDFDFLLQAICKDFPIGMNYL